MKAVQLKSLNSEKYHFSDFTYSEYKKLVLTAKEKWVFRSYENFSKDEKFALWRHDVDFSVHSARNLAIIENECGIKATYFLLPHCEYYNLFEKEITDLVRHIISLGHEIGLHFDTHFYGINDEEKLEQFLSNEKRWLQDVFEKEIKVFSFHNTSEFTMNCRKWEYAGLINTYAAYFQDEVEYCSDSNGIWRYRRLNEMIEGPAEKPIQVLTHPEWWQAEVMSPRQRIQRCIEGRSLKASNFYDNLLRNAQRPNIDWND